MKEEEKALLALPYNQKVKRSWPLKCYAVDGEVVIAGRRLKILKQRKK